MPPKGSTYVRGNDEVRFLGKIRREGECWIWTADTSAGYGRFRMPSGRLLAHRWSYEHFIGAIPEGYEIDHACRTPLCVRPSHLEAVTPDENARRRWLGFQQRTICRRGHPVVGQNARRTHGGRYLSCRACEKMKKRERERRTFPPNVLTQPSESESQR